MALEVKLKASDFAEEKHNDWCPGCGDFGILRAIQMALADLGTAQHLTAVVSGIGCSGKTPHYVNAYGVHTLHGRVLPFAMGVKLANPDLHVVAVGGDGDGLSIGAAHFVNAGRRNVDMVYVINDNAVYGLTKGQASPTMHAGVKTKSLPLPNVLEAVNPLWLALASGATFVARGYSFDIKHLRTLLGQAIHHRGYAVVDILQPCPTYNNVLTKEWFAGAGLAPGPDGKKRPRVYRLDERDYDGVVHEGPQLEEKLAQATVKALEWGDEIPIGVLYQNELLPTFEERIESHAPGYRKRPPARQSVRDEEGNANTDISRFLDQLKFATS